MTESGKALPYRRVYFRPAQLTPPLEDCFEFAHHELARGVPGQFLEFIGVAEPSDHEIKEKLANVIVPQLKLRWESTNHRLDLLKAMKEMAERGEVKAEQISEFVLLPTKNGSWLAPRDLLLSSIFSPDLDIQLLVCKGLLKEIPGEQPFEFVDPDLAPEPNQIEGWKRFLLDLGVEHRSHQQDAIRFWTSRIAVAASLMYERDRGRDVDSSGLGHVPGQEDRYGHDILAQEHNGPMRFIQVKGIGRGEGSVEIKASTLKAALFGKNRDNFYIYVVTDALRTPILHVFHAEELDSDQLLQLGNLRVTLQSLEGAQVEIVAVDQLLRKAP